MLPRCTRRVTILALLLLMITSIMALSPTVKAQSNRPQVVFAPSPTFPFPAPPPGVNPQPAPISGVLRVVVIAAAFSDINYTTSITDLKAKFTGAMASYYHEISYGTVTLQFDVFGWYQLPYPDAHYGRDCLAIDDADCSGADGSWQIAQDAVVLAQKKDNVNFGNYDDYIFVHSGYGQESSGVKDDVWSVTYLGGVYVQTNSKTLIKFNIVPDLEAAGAVPIGVYCHEFGHQLGLPDLYNVYNGRTILGPWSLMDKGLWNGNPPGASPAHMEAWSKIQLGFIGGGILAIANPGATSSFTIDPTEVASSNVHAVEIPLGSVQSPSEYYLIEVRAQIGFDNALPSSGVLITHVDNTVQVGKVQIMDGHPSVPDLNDATWDVGQSYTDSKNNIGITVTGKTGNSFKVIINGKGGPPPPIQNQTYIDLAITSVNAQPPVITNPNTTVTINVQISNLGTQGVSNVPVEVDLDGRLYTTTQVSVGAGSSTQTSYTWISVLGSHLFKITVDPNHAINDTNRANNVVTFGLNVGPTLTINLPGNLTSAGAIWVLINGIKYNITSSPFQASVPTGTVTVQIEPAVNTSLGVRQAFTGWSDGNLANPRQIVVTSNAVLQATYATQYLLAISQNGGSTTPSGWYNVNAMAQVNAVTPSNVVPQASRLLFDGWSGDVTSNSTTLSVNMTKPVTLQANWLKQFYVTVISLTSSATGTGWYSVGQIATIATQATVQYSNGTRQVFTGWDSSQLGNNPTAQIYVVAPTTVRAVYKTQYLVTIQSQYGAPTGAGWYDVGFTTPVSVQGQVDYANATRRVFTGWSGDYSGSSTGVSLRVDRPKTLTAKWRTEYLVTFQVKGISNSTMLKLNLSNSTYNLSVNNKFQAWLQKGATLTPGLNQTVVDRFLIYKFTGWQNSTGTAVNAPLTINAPATYVASYSTELSLPPIPGFPIEGILLGILIGSLMMVTIRRRRAKKHRID